MDAREIKQDFRRWFQERGKNDGSAYASNTINTMIGGVNRFWRFVEDANKRQSPFDYGHEDVDEFIRITKKTVNEPQFWRGKDSDVRIGYLRYLEYLKNENSNNDITISVDVKSDYEADSIKNLILYGPPGTGKTYNTVIKAVEIIDNKDFGDKLKADEYSKVLERYRQLAEEGKIAFVTFHQSYGYEEFIEGIKPTVDENDNVIYKVRDGVFKKFCETAKQIIHTKSDKDLIKPNATVWKVSIDSAGRNKFEFHDKCLDEGYIRVGWDGNEDVSLVTEGGKDSAVRFIDDMEVGDIVLSCYSQSEIDAIGIITGDYEWHDEEPRLKRFRKVKWLRTWREKEKYNIKTANNDKNLSQRAVYQLQISVDDIIKILNENPQQVNADKIIYGFDQPYVFIIDEINRGNISKIFGELITLIEPTKRLGANEAMTCVLPYSGKSFGVPKNIYILGTMNTADRSLVQLDAALRRRFDFEEMMPRYDLLKDIKLRDIELDKLLETINLRITALLDCEHQIGHSYFMKLNANSNGKDLKRIFDKNIIPLLQEYFFDDYELIGKVLGGKFVKTEESPIDGAHPIYKIATTDNIADYRAIYDNSDEK